MSIDNIFYVYVLINSFTGIPFYVGKGKGDRAWVHVKYQDQNRHKWNTIRKIENEGGKVRVGFIREGLSEADAFAWEWFWIAEFGRADQGLGPLTNMTDGEDGLAGLPRSEASKLKQAKAITGSNNHFHGKTHSEETKRRIAESRKGKCVGASNPQTGKVKSQSTLGKMSDATRNAVKTPCPHCSLPVDPRNMSRWHGDKCKQRRVS